jgi:hypothetical protein
MTDWAGEARTARQQLAQGLGVLQTPGLPPVLMNAAEPIAEAMSQLHRIESTAGAALREAAPLALMALRRALGLLQSSAVAHPACDEAIESVARSLGQVHGLAQHAEQAAAAPAAAAQGIAPFPLQPVSPSQPPPPPNAGQAPPQPNYGQQAPPAGYGQQAPHVAYGQQAPQPGYGQQAPQPGYAQQAPQPGYAQQAPPPYVRQAQAPQGQPAVPAYAPGAAAEQAPAQHAAAAQPPRAGARPPLRVEAELGAHSPTNFYKGLSGNDIIDSGGIFVATYQIPPVGSDVVVKVSLPGGYEFEALGVVAWTRDAPNSGADSPPGFGAKFSQISPEGRQLVYRYVRNREPLFHDDL